MAATKILLRFKHNNFYAICRTSYQSVLRCAKEVHRARPFVWMTCLSVAPFPVVSAWGFGKKEEDTKGPPGKAEEIDPDKVIMQEADLIYKDGKVQELYDYLIQYKSSSNPEILWRLCRAVRDKAEVTYDSKQRKELMLEAFEYIKQALAIDDANFAIHKWYAIMLDKTGELEGTKQRLTNAYKVKEHFMKAIDLNPNDATSIHLLGFWCFTFADLPWYQRQVASVIFTTPPSSSYEEAQKYFLEAEKVDPNFYSMNLLMLGKTYLMMKQNDLALEYLRRAKDYPVKTADDKQAQKEAVQLLKSMGEKV